VVERERVEVSRVWEWCVERSETGDWDGVMMHGVWRCDVSVECSLQHRHREVDEVKEAIRRSCVSPLSAHLLSLHHPFIIPSLSLNDLVVTTSSAPLVIVVTSEKREAEEEEKDDRNRETFETVLNDI
jgi:hypothetical protein